MQRPVPRAQVQYKKPSMINPVSIMVFLLLGALGYLAFCYWPTIRLKSNVTSEMQEALVQFYRINLRQDKRRVKDVDTTEKALRAALAKVGVDDPNLLLKIGMTPKLVSLDLEFISQYELVGLEKRYPLHQHIHVETDAARIDW